MTIPDDILSNPEAFKQFQASQEALSSALSRLMVVVERYPDLKANQNFLALQSQLEGTENRIAVARRDYIEAVKRYNTEFAPSPAAGGRHFSIPTRSCAKISPSPQRYSRRPKWSSSPEHPPA